MSNFLTLTKILMKTSSSLIDGTSKKQTSKSIGIAALLIVACLPMVVMLYMVINSLYGGFVNLQQEGALVGVIFYVDCILIFLFAIFIAPSIFYFSKDIESLLPLPLKPEEIILSKFTITLLYEYLTSSVILIPLYAVIINHNGFHFDFFINAIIIFLTLPVLPLLYSCTLTMIIMRVTNVGKNKDFFNMVGGIVTIIAAMGISMYSQSFARMDTKSVLTMLSDGNNSLLNALGFIFPNIKFAVNGMLYSEIAQLLLHLACVVVGLVIFIILAKLIYFKGVIGITETSSSRKKLASADLDKMTSKQNVLLSYTVKEIKLLFRTPVYFLNCVLVNFIFPIFLLIPQMSNANVGFAELKNMIDFTDTKTFGIAVSVGAALGILTASMNGIAASAISREGQNYFIMKYIPVPYQTQINAKVLSAMSISLLGDIFFFIVATVILDIPILVLIAAFVYSLLSIFFVSYLGIIIDLIRPVLVWENEQKAVKQNLNVVISIFGGMGVAGLLVYMSFALGSSSIIAVIILVVLVILDVITYRVAMRTADKRISDFV